MRLRAALLAGCAATAMSCGGHGTVVQPTPTPEAPTLTCPADVAAASHAGQTSSTASFDVPAAQDGQPPVTVTCSPPTGSEFPIGSTTVTCEATDTLQRKASCSFSVVVTPIPQVLKTTFMSFGDSVTEGKTSVIQGILKGPSSTTFPGNYPQILEEKLSARYLDQTITVIADGFGGKHAADDDSRLGAELTVWNPDVLLLQEGANDLLNPNGPEIGSAADGLETMVRDAKAHRTRVFLGTVLRMNPGAPKSTVSQQAADAVPRLNDLIRAIAVRQNVTLVDLNSAVPLSAIGDDGVHPRALGEEIIADEFLRAVIATMEVSPSTP